MTTLADKTPLESPNLRAVGWLGRDLAFARGDVDGAFVEKLAALASNPWQPGGAHAGLHRCELCRFSGGPSGVRIGEHTVGIGVNNVFVPDGALCWVAPASIVHYIDAHEYQPPSEFLACPQMRSMDYLRALHAAGVSGKTIV